MVERNMSNAVMRGIVVPPGSRPTSRAQGARRNLGDLVSDHRPCATFHPGNPQDRSGSSNRQDMTQPRSFNPQDMRQR
jgi:hypothetical protein